jgi:hypothetical protein
VQASAAKPNDKHAAGIRRQSGWQPIIEQLMGCHRQRYANNRHDQRPTSSQRSRAPSKEHVVVR